MRPFPFRLRAAAVLAGLLLAGLSLAGLSLAGLSLAGLSSAVSAQTQPTRLDAVTGSGILKVCTTGDYRPFSYLDPATGSFEGLDIDMAQDLATALGAKPLFVSTSWNGLMGTLTSGACDIGMGGITITLDRQKAAYFSLPLMTDGKASITRCENVGRFQTLAQIDRPEVTVAVNPGGQNEAFARSMLRQARMVVFPDNRRIFEEILAGRADLMVTDAVEARLQEKRHPGLCAVHPEAPFTFTEKAYLLPRGDDVWKAFVDQWLRLRMNDGTYEAISARWIR